MLTGILIISVLVFISVIAYRRPRLERRVFKNIPLIDWINILILPILLYFGLVFIVKNIITRGRVERLDIDELYIFLIGNLFLVYAFVGNSLHFVGKVLSRYLKPRRHSLIYQINEIFHGKLSHFMTFICVAMLIFLLGILEINYPLLLPLAEWQIILIILAGITTGISSVRSVLYAASGNGYRGYNRPLFFLIFLQMIVLHSLYKIYKLNLSFFPLNLFIIGSFGTIVGMYLFRRLLYSTRLDRKRRLKFLAKILSA